MPYDVNGPGQPGRRLVNGGNERMLVLKETLDAFADAPPGHGPDNYSIFKQIFEAR